MSQAVSRTPAELARRDLSARQAITAASVAMVAVLGLDLIDGRVGLLYSVGFILIVVTVPLSVDARALLPAAVFPPALLLGSLLVVCVIAPSAIQPDGLAADASVIARWIAGVLDHGRTLIVGQLLTLALIGLRSATTPRR